MRKLFVFLFLLNLPFITQAQVFPSEKYQSEKIIWLGLDFTLAKLVDAYAFTDPTHVATSYIPAWNHFVISEEKKYDVKKYFHKSDMEINLEFTTSYNEAINPDNLVQNGNYSLESDLAVNDAKKYATSGLDGIGIVMYVESYNKNAVMGTYWLTLIELSSGKALFVEKVSGKPKGFGVRNYWAGTFYQALKSIDKSMKQWLN